MNIKSNTTLMIALILLALGLPTAAWAQDMDDGDATAEVQEIPISLVQDRALTFGTFMPLGRPGSVVIDLTGGGINYHDVHVIESADHANWTASGVPNAPLEIVVVSDSTTLTNGSDTMEVSNIHHNVNLEIFPEDGNFGFSVGATLDVNANQAPGFYTGTYQLRAAYN